MLTSLFLLASAMSAAAEAPRLESTPEKLGIPYERYTTKDALGRTITFYLSAAMSRQHARLPLVLYIQGSGCQSLFQKHGKFIGGGYHNLILQEGKGRVRVLVVEKPGVQYLDAPQRPGSAVGASDEFLKEHTLPRWSEANVAALRAAWKLPEVDPEHTLVVGHSEGGLVAACVVAELPRVTHVASLSGGGPTQLFDLAFNAGRGRDDDKPGDASRRMQQVYEEWTKIEADPDSIRRFWLGHPYRRWCSFLKDSLIAELLRTKARIYLAQGMQDAVIPVAAHDVLAAELRAHGRDVTEERVEGADHGFQPKNAPPGPPAGMQALFGRLLRWYLDQKPAAK